MGRPIKDLFEYMYLMADAVKRFNDELVVIDLNNLPDDQKNQVLEIIANKDGVDSLLTTDFIRDIVVSEVEKEDKDVNLNIVGYLIGDNQYNFIKASEDTSTYKKGKYYNISFARPALKDGEPAGVSGKPYSDDPNQQFLVFDDLGLNNKAKEDPSVFAELLINITTAFHIFNLEDLPDLEVPEAQPESNE